MQVEKQQQNSGCLGWACWFLRGKPNFPEPSKLIMRVGEPYIGTDGKLVEQSFIVVDVDSQKITCVTPQSSAKGGWLARTAMGEQIEGKGRRKTVRD